jgi:hypothetical protein
MKNRKIQFSLSLHSFKNDERTTHLLEKETFVFADSLQKVSLSRTNRFINNQKKCRKTLDSPKNDLFNSSLLMKCMKNIK